MNKLFRFFQEVRKTRQNIIWRKQNELLVSITRSFDWM